MWVVYNADTGYSDESMRFAHIKDALDYMDDNADQPLAKRWEED